MNRFTIVHLVPTPLANLLESDSAGAGFLREDQSFNPSIARVYAATEGLDPTLTATQRGQLAVYVMSYGYRWMTTASNIDNDVREYLYWALEAAGFILGDGKLGDAVDVFLSLGRCGCPDDDARPGVVARGMGKLDLSIVKFAMAGTPFVVRPIHASKCIKDILSAWGQLVDMEFHEGVFSRRPDVVVAAEHNLWNLQTWGHQSIARAEIPDRKRADGPMRLLFNPSFRWAMANANITPCFPTAFAHQVSHVLGLGHTKNTNSLCNPYYQGPCVTPTADDVMTVQDVYAADSEGGVTATEIANGTGRMALAEELTAVPEPDTTRHQGGDDAVVT